MKHYLSVIVFTFFFIFLNSSCRHHHCPANTTPAKPKLIVGIVVDQMRWDFLYRYSGKYSENGFKRLLREGYSCGNTHINYSPSTTGPGHTCVYTGSVPAIHGITGNSWYDYKESRVVNCVDDTSVTTIGASSSTGKKSPHRMLTTTITDELRLATNFQSKVIGIALKDRSAILPAGHTANAAYFLDGASGNWVTSSYYMKEMPTWVNQFNGKKLPEKYLSQNWSTLRPIGDYTESDRDAVPYEKAFSNETIPAFEHKVSALMQTGYEVIANTPYGNTLTLDFAEAAITGETLGKGNNTDFLTVSLSSTDLIGHQFGPNSVEIEDCYLRLDKDLENFFAFLDAQIGKGNYLLFLTADHGAAHAPDFLNGKNVPSGVFPMDSLRDVLEATLEQKYGEGKWLVDFENMQFYFNNALIAEKKKVRKSKLKKTVKDFLLQQDGIANVIDLENFSDENIEPGIKQDILNGIHKGRSGDLFVLYNPAWLDHFSKGTTHGTIYPYDTHIPLIWMGWHVHPGEDFSEVNMTDIAPTLAAMLHIQEPNGCVGKPINALLKEPRGERPTCPH